MAMYPNPQPKLKKKLTTPGMSVRSGAGQNAKGSANKINPALIPSSKPKPASGFFQWGAGQYGFLNPQGNINWEAMKPPKDRPLIARPPGKPPTPVKPDPAPWMDPQFMKESRGLEHELALAEKDYGSELARMREAFTLGSESAERAIGSRADLENASLAARGFARSGMADTSVLTRERDLRDALRQLGVDFGKTRQDELIARVELLKKQVGEKKQILSSEARKRFEAQNKILEAAGETPKSIELQKRFFKKGSTWFYRNPQGVTVSLGTQTPEAMKRKLARKKQGAANKVETIRGQQVNIL
jgi:hypothetical protein